MNSNDSNQHEALVEFLCRTEHQTKQDALAELASNGVKLDEFRSKVATIVRKGYQRQVRQAAESASIIAQSAKSSLFGDLAGKSMAELLAIRDQLTHGVFGARLQQAAVARCRNHQGEEVSEQELRSWLEDISAAAPET